MALLTGAKQGIVEGHRRHEKDSGSAEVQIALFSRRIGDLTEHLKIHKKDHSSRRGLLKLVGKRSSMLKYLATTDRQRYQDIIGKLGLRK